MLCREVIGIYCENCLNTAFVCVCVCVCVCVEGGGCKCGVPKYLYDNNKHSLFKG